VSAVLCVLAGTLYRRPAGSKSAYLLQMLLVAVEGTGNRELALVEKRVEFVHTDREDVPIGIQ
jgi:hypothetical protein